MTLQVGQFNQLKVESINDSGAKLSEDVFLPKSAILQPIETGATLNVFVYQNKEQWIGSLEAPYAQVYEVAYLRVAEVNNFGIFLDWGLPKQLMLPYKESGGQMREGRRYMVFLYLDKATNRVVASANLPKFIKNRDIELKEHDQVNISVVDFNEVGTRVIINHKHWGIVYKNESFKKLRIGDTDIAYVKKIREDGKIDLSMQKIGFEAIGDAATQIMALLEKNNGFLPLTDKTPPDVIYQRLKMSKKVFKKSIGGLYKRRIIDISKEGIRLV